MKRIKICDSIVKNMKICDMIVTNIKMAGLISKICDSIVKIINRVFAIQGISVYLPVSSIKDLFMRRLVSIEKQNTWGS